MAAAEDAAGIIELQERLGREEDFLLVTPLDPVTGALLLMASLGPSEPPGASRVIVAEGDGEIVGLVLCRDHQHPSLSGMVHLALCVDRDHRRRGVGTSLLRRVLEWARENGVRRLQLAVFAANHAALATYRKAGFEIEGTLRDAAVIGETAHDLHILARLVVRRHPGVSSQTIPEAP